MWYLVSQSMMNVVSGWELTSSNYRVSKYGLRVNLTLQNSKKYLVEDLKQLQLAPE